MQSSPSALQTAQSFHLPVPFIDEPRSAGVSSYCMGMHVSQWALDEKVYDAAARR
jgi:hypothetical protein